MRRHKNERSKRGAEQKGERCAPLTVLPRFLSASCTSSEEGGTIFFSPFGVFLGWHERLVTVPLFIRAKPRPPRKKCAQNPIHGHANGRTSIPDRQIERESCPMQLRYPRQDPGDEEESLPPLLRCTLHEPDDEPSSRPYHAATTGTGEFPFALRLPGGASREPRRSAGRIWRETRFFPSGTTQTTSETKRVPPPAPPRAGTRRS